VAIEDRAIVSWRNSAGTLDPAQIACTKSGCRDLDSPVVVASRSIFIVGSEDSTSCSLLIKAAASDREAWNRLVNLYAPLVAHWCRQAGLQGDGAEDVIQEVFAAMAAGLKTYQKDRPGTGFRGWMRGIARHKLQDHFRRATAPAEGGTEALVRLRAVPEPVEPPNLSESDSDVAELYRRALELVRGQFEERTWQAFWKVAMENRSPTEAASELGMTPNTVRQAKSRILRRLKEELGELIA
jgi:RNA polymerase sigma-70 factor, ECF subfamily